MPLMSVPLPPSMQGREHQMFPVLETHQLEFARRFGGEPMRYGPGAHVWRMGDRGTRMHLVLEGALEVHRRDGIGHDQLIVVESPGMFSGEIASLSNRAALADGRAGPEGLYVVPFDVTQVRALINASAELGEIIMRAFILRRVALIEGSFGNIVLGHESTSDVMRIQVFLTRQGIPHSLLDPATDSEAAALLEKLGVGEADLPIVVCSDGSLLKNPSNADVARCLGITPELVAGTLYDVAVVGAGPAGLATAVYAASEGLSVIVLDAKTVGGQAGASARIENYLGFPTGISGQALMGRAFSQASKFGAEVAVPLSVARVRCGGTARSLKDPVHLDLDSGISIKAKTVVVASGARYRRPAIDRFADFEGHGVYYWASKAEKNACVDQEIVLIGGGNSAGQAVVFLAPAVKKLHLVVRRDLGETMSRYLVDRIQALPNVEIHTGCEVCRLEGEPQTGLAGLAVKSRDIDGERVCSTRHLFSFIGADPNTDWLADCDVKVDTHGFVVTGTDVGPGARMPLETSVPGIFAIGDVRCGSTKRVAAAVGEGASVVAQIHRVLAHT
jgi:thioredoxin reductase (NADPH)